MAYRHKSDIPPRGTSRRPYPRQQAGSSRPGTPKPKFDVPQPPTGGLFSTKLVMAILLVFVLVYIGHSIWVFWTPTVDTMILRMSTIQDPRSVTGIIIREEQVYYADRDGVIEFWVQDHDRVRVNYHVASVLNPDMVPAATERLNITQENALSVQNRRAAISVTEAEVQRLNNNMGSMVNTRLHNFTALNLSEIYLLRDRLNQVISTRNQISIGDGLSAREPLAREHQHHMEVLMMNSTDIYVETSGIMSRIIDGKESDLTRASIRYLTRDDVRQVVDYATLVPRQVVRAGEPVFKIVGNNWYIAAYMPNDMIDGFNEGETRTIYLRNANSDSYEPHVVRIQSIDYGARYSMVVFRNTRHVIEFLNQRNVSIRTVSGIQHGLKLPDTAIYTRQYFRIPTAYIHGEANQYILLSMENGDIRVAVTVDNAYEGYVYTLTNLEPHIGSLLVPRSIADPHILLTTNHIWELHGVFVVRFGIAEFRQIDLGGRGVETGYVLLDPALNPGVHEFANIVIDASTVQEGDIIR